MRFSKTDEHDTAMRHVEAPRRAIVHSRRTLSRAVEMTLAAPSTPAFTGRPSLLRAAASARRARAAHRRGALVVVAGKKGAKAKNKDSGRSIHFRQGPERFNAGGVGEVARGGKGSGKTTRSQRTNKVYKTYLSGRPTVDDVERASQGDRTKAMGVVEREAPYRLNRAHREAWERAKRRGGHGFGDGTGGGGVLEVRTTATSALAPHRNPLINTHRLFCDAKRAAFVVIEQEDEGRDDVVIDLSTLRVDVDGPIRARLMELADAHSETILSREDLCEALGEPLEAQVRYIRGLEADIVLVESERTTDVFSPEAPSPEAPSPEALASAETAVDEMAARVRAMKDGGATNADETVREAVAALLARKAHLSSLRDAAEAATPEAAAAAAAEAEANAERWTEEAKRTIQELPIHNLPERYLRFQCADRPTAKALAKAIATEKLYPLLERLERTDEETAAEAPNEVDSVVVV